MGTKKQKRALRVAALFIFLWFVSIVAGGLIAAAYLIPSFAESANETFIAICQNPITLYVTIGVFGVSTIAIIICIAHQKRLDKERAQGIEEFDREPSQRKAKREKKRKDDYAEIEVIGDAEAQLDGSTTHNGESVQYIPSQEAYEFVNMGSYQSLEDKFDQISKMDRTQFVIYVARLFARKGYQVKLTPVIDNHDIDLIVEKMGVTIAVGCLLTNKILSDVDITCVKHGKAYYNVTNAMALTNMYFDRSALDYAKAERLSLVDRNILAEDFMS